ncbi:MAG: hypothetical protein ACLPVF_08155 [Acidimicrobiales bacterium]
MRRTRSIIVGVGVLVALMAAGIGPLAGVAGATGSHVVRTGSSAPATHLAAGPTFNGSDIVALVMDFLAVLALGFLIVTFSRRRAPTS